MLLNDAQIMQAMLMIIDMFPEAQPSLFADSDFQYLIAVMLSAQTTDRAVNQVTPKLFAVYPTPQKLAQATIEQVEHLIKSLGLYHNKARNLIKCSNQLLTNFAGQVPATKQQLVTLAGVGTKTANVVLGDRFGVPSFAVDTHVSKISKRLHFVDEKATVEQIEKSVTKALDPKYWVIGHHALIDLGRKYNFKNATQIANLPVVRQCDQWSGLNEKK
ncbi:endonuclease III domain-containing protein [Bombilactobacillus thymidiniphilus]|uniref:Endonuclease III n=1 Tax=Bombilactobacillus thymidiniphilus TaxID=2923363 RepID=A0ABY4PDH3_9LACO|nr:endonuclease III [Bombilactobacillus thymidiniphilus]UQS83566.1 endonuclease III [Bombilactobacillus thymidiniphilus]